MLGHRVRHEDRTRPVEADDVRLERNRLAEVELTFGLSTTDRFSTSDEEDGEVMDNGPSQHSAASTRLTDVPAGVGMVGGIT